MDQFWNAVGKFGYFEYLIAALALALLTGIIQARLNSTYKKYSQIGNSKGMTGADAARQILEANGIYDVQVQMINGHLTDNYHPKKKILSLSPEVYYGTSVSAVGIAAHEAGHAIQHSRKYVPVKLRGALVPVANLGSRFSMILVIIGLIISGTAQTNIGFYLALAGLGLFLFAVLFTLVTLPVEFNASRRAKNILSDTLYMSGEDMKGVKKVLNAAAMTYVASLASAVLSLFRMLAIVSSSRRND